METIKYNLVPKTVILGLGNPLLSDEGLGVYLIHALSEANLPPTVQLVDGGTAGLLLLSVVEQAERLLVLDAVNGGKQPGTILQSQDIPRYGQAKLSPHQLGFQEVLAIADLQGKLPKEIALIGIQPHSLAWGCGLSQLVRSRVPELLEMIHKQLQDWGIPNKINTTVADWVWCAPNANVLL